MIPSDLEGGEGRLRPFDLATRLRVETVASLSSEETAELLSAAVVVSEEDTRFTGPIRILSVGDTTAVLEQSDDGETLLRRLASLEEAQRFVRDRLDTYERMWDGCGCKVDYHA